MKSESVGGRTLLVTGASRGIGAAIARAAAAQGWRVVCAARSVDALERVTQSIRESGAEAVALVGDVTASGFEEQVRALERPIDAWVHAAAAFAPFGDLSRVRPEQLRAVVDTGLVSALTLAGVLVTPMRARGFGRVVCIGSLVGELGGAGQAAYASAKAGLVGLVRSLAVEAGADGVTANLVELGLFDTERTRAALAADVREALVRATPARRMGLPEEAAAVVAFLLSPQAAFVNGAIVPVTGGLGLGLPTRLGRAP